MRIKNFFEILYVKVAANLKIEIAQYYLNYAWWVLEPIMTMGVFYLVFGILLNRGTEYFVAFLLVGLTSWNWFSQGVSSSLESILKNKSLILQTKIPKIIFPWIIVCQTTFKHFIVTGILLLFLVFYPTPITICWISLPLLMVVQFLLITATATFCAAIVPFLPDLTFVIKTLLRLMFYGSGVFFNIDKVVLPEHTSILYLNPIAGLLQNYRKILIYGEWPDWVYIGNVFIFSCLFMLLAILMVFRLDDKYPRVCMQ